MKVFEFNFSNIIFFLLIISIDKYTTTLTVQLTEKSASALISKW